MLNEDDYLDLTAFHIRKNESQNSAIYELRAAKPIQVESMCDRLSTHFFFF